MKKYQKGCDEGGKESLETISAKKEAPFFRAVGGDLIIRTKKLLRKKLKKKEK